MTDVIDAKRRAGYGGLFYHVVPEGTIGFTLTKRQNAHVFATYQVYWKQRGDLTWLECDCAECVAYHDPTACKHVKMVEAHLQSGQRESAVRWIR